MYARPSPSFRSRCNTSTKACSAASPSASAPVPSGESSSITRTRSPSRRTSASAAIMRGRFSRSLYVGRQTVARKGAPMIAAVTDLPRNEALAEQFDLLADLMELEGADSFRIGAYRKASARIRETPASVAQLALDGKAKQLQDIGKTIEAKIVEVVDDGEIHALTKRKADVPAEVATFMRLPGLGPKTARRIWKELGITTVDGLKAAAEAQELRGHAGIGPGTEQKIAEALARPRAAEGPHRALLATTLPKLRAVVQVL